jgi:hypothetical protein
MKREERLAYRYLKSLGLGEVVYEPERNLPPDFLISETIAVEVRRLNQNEAIAEGGALRGLEETWIPFNMQFRKLLASFGQPPAGCSWFVSYSLARPLPPWRELRSALKSHLANFRDNPSNKKVQISVSDGLEISLFPATKVHPTLFLWGAGSDHDSGGFIVHEILKNLRLCVEEKTRKIASHRHKYPTWWLVFIDLIGWGLDELDRSHLQEHWRMEHDWNKIILLDPSNATSAFELCSHPK